MIAQRSRSSKRVFGTNLANSKNNLASSSRSIKKPKAALNSRLNPQMTLHDYLKSIDLPKKVQGMFLDGSVFKNMRKILVEWLVGVQAEFKLCQQTLYLGVCIFDKTFTTENNFKPEDMQLVGITALWMAAKYQEVYPPQMKYFSEVTNGAFSKKDMLRVQEQMINSLDFNLSFPTRYQLMLVHLGKLGILPNSLIFQMCHYILELTLVDSWEYREHEIADAALFLANKMLQRHGVQTYGFDVTSQMKKAAFKLAQIIGKCPIISKKYDCQQKNYVGGYILQRKDNNSMQ